MKKIRYDRTIDILKRNIEEYIDTTYTPESRIVVFGTSIIAGIIVAFFRKNNIEPEFFIDNAKHIQGYDTYGLKVYSPKVLEDNFDENFTVMIASSFQEEMQNQLEAMGYKENKNIIKIIDLSKMANSYDLELQSNMIRLTEDEYKAEMLRVLVKLDEVCRKNNLKYFINAGTFLGAVRHQGYIPWDDDIDVYMEIKDMKRLSEILKDDEEFQFVCMFDESDYFSTNALMYSNKYVAKLVKFPAECEIGVNIDVFPLFGVPDNMEEIKKFMGVFRQMESNCWQYFYEKEKFKEKVNELFDYLCTYDFNDSKYLCTTSNGGLNNIVEQKYYTSISTYKFEGYDLLAPSDYDYILTKKYGDYMTFPSPEKRVGKHFVNAYKYE